MWQRIRDFLVADIRRRILTAMLIVSLPVLLISTTYSVYVVRKMVYGYVAHQQELHVRSMEGKIQSFLSGVQSDVLFLSHSEEIKDLVEEMAQGDTAAYRSTRGGLAREFLAFAQAKQSYYQVRFIDASGQEVVRVVSDPVTHEAFIVPEEQLQNKADRYYFQDTIALKEGQVFVSPLDLNREHGEIERPFQPVIRYATPVWMHGKAVGIVIVNVFAAPILEQLREQSEPDEVVALVDQDGYYLFHSKDESRRWGRDLGTDVKLSQDYPQVAQQIINSSGGKQPPVVIGDNFITYTFLSPPGDSNYHWILLSARPKRVVLADLLFFEWVILVLLILSVLIVFVASQWTSNRLVRPIRQLERMAARMEQGDLEQPISLSTRDELGHLAETLEQARRALLASRKELSARIELATRQAKQLRLSAQVAAAAAAEHDPQILLDRVVELIREQFGFYHAGIFIVDPSGEWAILRAASSRGGKQMLARGHRLKVGQQGLVGYVVKNKVPRIALDVGEDAVHFVNPDLPETRSEIALPLLVREQVIGVLDVQSKKTAAFDDEDIAILQTLADQLALAIHNARLFQQVREDMAALRKAYGEYSYRAWVETSRESRRLGYVYRDQTLYPAEDIWLPEMSKAVQEAQVTISPDDPCVVAVPVRFRGYVIGVLDARKDRPWMESEIALLETLSEQLGVALDSARLYQESRLRAAREQTVGEISAHIRETLDLEMVLKIAAEELRKVLDTPELTVRLAVDQES